MKIVTYNIQYGVGTDGGFDLQRIADTVDGADVIGLNEVERFWPRGNGLVDQPAELAALLPHYYWVYGPYCDLDGSEQREDNTILNRRGQHGSMILSRQPIVTSRLHCFPKFETNTEFNMQLGGLEAVIDYPSQPIRFYSVHLSSVQSEERLAQIRTLLEIDRRTRVEGGVWTGDGSIGAVDWSGGKVPPPRPSATIIMGDFNAEPDSQEYQLMSGAVSGPTNDAFNFNGFVDCWHAVGDGTDGATYFDNPRPDVNHDMRIDYIFVSANLAEKLGRARVDRDAQGSDHQPLWLEFAF